MNIAFHTESARNLFEKKGFSDNSSHLHSTLSFSPIVFLNVATLSQVFNLDLHFLSVRRPSPLPCCKLTEDRDCQKSDTGSGELAWEQRCL